MTITDALPWLNLLLIPIASYVINIDRRLTRLEALREAADNASKGRGATA